MEASERLIVALDLSNGAEALDLVDRLEGVVRFYKVGLELFVAEGPQFVRELRQRGLRVFLDLKMDDVGETISRAVTQVAALDVDFLTILGGDATANAANAAKGPNLKTLQITVLTSLGEQDLNAMGLVGEGLKFAVLEDYILWRAERSIKNGCNGLISSGQNVTLLREKLGKGPILVCPGIRPANTALEDHKRPATPFDTIRSGADYLVVGRPIRNAGDPVETAKAVIGDIERGLSARAY